MNWQYVEQGQPVGPVNDEQLAALVRAGKINADTLVWREGMADWLPYNQVRSELKISGSVPDSSAAAVAPLAATDKTTEAVCSECGNIFPVDEMIRHGESRICSNCKPVFMQKLTEGAQLNTGGLHYHQVITRFAVQMAIGIGYEVFMIGKYGATLGKMACKIKVVTADGGRVSYARALGRYFAKLLSAFTCMIGYIIAFFDEEKRALHDRICDTRVVYK